MDKRENGPGDRLSDVAPADETLPGTTKPASLEASPAEAFAATTAQLRSSTPAANGPSKPTITEQAHWLKRIFGALSLANVIALAVLIIGVPAALLSWDAWKNKEAAKRDADEDRHRAERATQAAEAQARTEQERLKREQIASVPANTVPPKAKPVLEPSPMPAPSRERPIIIKEAQSDSSVQALLTRPFLYLKSVRLLDFAAGQKAVWDMYIGNKGRPTEYTATSWVGVVDSPKTGYVVPSCQDTITYGGKHSIVDEIHSQPQSQTPVSDKDFLRYQAGSYVLASTTYCYRDEITDRQYVTKICMMKTKDGQAVACPSG